MTIFLLYLVTLFLIAFYVLILYFRIQKKTFHSRQKYHEAQAQSKKLTLQIDSLNNEIIQLKKQLDKNVFEDHLTGLPTRLFFEDRLVQTIEQSERYHLNFAVMIVDLDSFEIVNGVLGYEAGDQLLKEVAKRLCACIRKVDTASHYGGDRFNIILPQLSKSETAAFVAKRFLDAISMPFFIQQQELFITAAIGIAVFPQDGTDVSTLMKNANSSLQQAKKRGKNNYQFYQEEMHVLSRKELLLNSSLHREDIYQEFLIYYQPQINVKTNEVFCMEAFLRWQHPDFGLISPKEFWIMAENSGKSVEIGNWVLKNACEQFKKWKENHYTPDFLSVNISFRQLENPHFTYTLAKILNETNMDPKELILDISEKSLDKQTILAEKTLCMLKQQGINIAIDDFGTGMLSLQHLKKFPVDYLKIDQSLTHEIISNKESVIIVKMIIALTESLHIKVIAEGIENINQKDALYALGCTLMQGHYFGHPRPAKEFPMILNKIPN